MSVTSAQLRRRAITAWSLLFAAFALAVAFGGNGTASLRADVPKGADFVAFWSAGALLSDGAPDQLYSPRGLRRRARVVHPEARRYRGLYPPPLYQVFEAAQPLGYVRAVRVHLLGGLLLVLLGTWLISEAVGLDPPTRALVLVFAVAGPFSFMNLLSGQLAGLWLTGLGGGLLLLRRGRPFLAGLVLALLCAKPQFGAVAALWLLLMGQGRALAGFVLGGAGLLLASLLWGGIEPWVAWLELLGGDHLGRFAPMRYRSLSLPALISLPLRGWSDAVSWSRLLSLAGLAGALLLARPAFRMSPSAASWPLRAGLVLSALLLSLPHMLEYDFGLHGLLLLASLPLARGRGRWLFVGVLVCPLLGPAARLTGVAWAPLLILGWLLLASRSAPPEPQPPS